MSKRNHIVERASDVNGGQYIQTNPSYNSGYEDGKKAGKEYCASEITTLRKQVEKLENRLNKDSQEFTILCAKETEKVLREQLAALAEQNEKLRETLEMIVVSSLTHPRVSAYAAKALSLPDLATSILNKEGEIK